MRTLLFFLLLVWLTGVNATEQINHFHARIQVQDSGDIVVTETIDVTVTHNKIRHGLFRSTPTVYFGVFFTHKNSDIIIMDTTLDGKKVDYHQENLINGIRVYLGSKDYLVSTGRHTYVIQYLARGQVVDLQENDGLYWNVTGLEWDFPILKASTDIYLPNLAEFTPIVLEAWTGHQGSTEKNYTVETFSDHVHFATTSRLNSNQGLTIQASWPKGFITNKPNVIWVFLKNNFLWLLSVSLLIFYPWYFFSRWKKVGIDPPKGAVFPQFTPPNKLSPAAMGYIQSSYYDSQKFSVALMNLAVKKAISIEQKSKNTYLLTRLDNAKTDILSTGEARIFNHLFKHKNSISIDKTYNSSIKTANDLLQRTLVDEHKNACFKNNLMAWIMGVTLSVLIAFINWGHFYNFSSYAVPFLVMSLLLIIMSAVSLIALKRTHLKIIAILVAIIIATLALLAQSQKPYSAFIGIILFMLLTNSIFYALLKAPTVFGRKILDHIAGFKLYLKTAEQDRLELMHPPTMTPELFEKYLPYALALGVENSWSQQFSKAMKVKGEDYQSYQPSWYIGSHNSNYNFASTATALGAGLASSVVSASTPPSSNSSGGFGGGSSGGGGGGGGGGGW